MGTAVSHPDKVGAKVDVGCHDGIKAGLALVDQLGEGGPVVGIADHKALLAVVLAAGAYTEINSDLMLAFAPFSGTVNSGLRDSGQSDGGCQSRHSPSCPVAPSPDAGDDTTHAVIDVFTLIDRKEEVVSVCVLCFLVIVIHLSDGDPLTAVGLTAARHVALYFPSVVGRDVIPTGMVDAPSEDNSPVGFQHRIQSKGLMEDRHVDGGGSSRLFRAFRVGIGCFKVEIVYRILGSQPYEIGCRVAQVNRLFEGNVPDDFLVMRFNGLDIVGGYHVGNHNLVGLTSIKRDDGVHNHRGL